MGQLRFTEKELAILYEHTEAPYLFDGLVQGLNPDPNLPQKLHEIIGHQNPDIALLALCLCGLVVARDLRHKLTSLQDPELADAIKSLNAELEQHAHECLYTIGRLWLDSVVFELDVNPIAGLHVLRDIPTNLQIMASIFGELREYCDETEPLRAGLNILYYQAESQADRAEDFVAAMVEPPKTRRKAVLPAAHVPLPLDVELVQALDSGGKVIPFSVFAAKSKEKK